MITAAPPILYDIVVSAGSVRLVIDWESERGWAKKYGQALAAAEWIALRPRPGAGLPPVLVALGAGRRWIITTRVYRESGRGVRVYGIGWQTTVGGRNIKSILWTYTDGSVELSESPGHVRGGIAPIL